MTSMQSAPDGKPRERRWAADPRVGLALTIGALTLLHLWAAQRIGIDPDEAYYWLWSLHPSFGYFDHPPMVAWWMAAGVRLFGDNAFGIRFFSTLSVAATSAALYATARLLFEDAKIAVRAAVWMNGSFLIAIDLLFATPDEPSVLFWSLATLTLAGVIKTGKGFYWVLFGLAAGLGVISKFTNLFLGVSVGLFLIADARGRRWLTSPWLWTGFVVAVFIALPTFIWNAEHQWVTVSKQFGRLVDGSLSWRHVAGYPATQIGLLNPLLFVFAAAAAWRWCRNADAPYRRETGLLLAIVAPMIVYFARHSFYGPVRENWLAPIYPDLALLAALGAACAPVGVLGRSQLMAACKRTASPLGIGLSLLVLVYLANPVPAFSPFRDPSRSRGWGELATRIDDVRRSNGATWIATTDYHPAAELSFHLRSQTTLVAQVTQRVRYGFLPASAISEPNANAILIVEPDTPPAEYAGCFSRLTKLETLSEVAGIALWASYDVFLAEGPKANILRDGCGAL